VVLSGSEKGKRGRVISVIGKKQRVIVEGARMIKRHMRKSQTHPQGAIVEREGSLHISNVMKAQDFDARAAKRGTTAPAAS
jgi:large subunit ribosomal protein L24